MSKHNFTAGVPVATMSSHALTAKDLEKLLKLCQKRALSYLNHALDGYCRSLSKVLDGAAQHSGSQPLLMQAQQFRARQKEFKRYFNLYFFEGFSLFAKGQLTAIAPFDTVSPNQRLSLAEFSNLDEVSIVQRVAQRLSDKLSDNMWLLNRRLAILNNGFKVTDIDNPAGPVRLCDALRKTLNKLSFPANTKAAAYRVFEQKASRLVQLIIDDTNKHLAHYGVLPNLVVPVKAPADSLADSPMSTHEPTDTVAVQSDVEHSHQDPGRRFNDRLGHDIRSLQARLQANVDSDHHILAAEEIIAALNVLQDQAPQIQQFMEGSEPASQFDIDQLSHTLLRCVEKSAGSQIVGRDDMAMITHVGLLFDELLDDACLPDKIKALLSYLQSPYLKMALADSAFFLSDKHPAKVLMAALVEAGKKWVAIDGLCEFGILDKIQQVVSKIVHCRKNEVKVVTGQLFSLRSAMRRIERQQALTEARAKQKIEGEDRLIATRQLVNGEIQKRIHERELPSPVLLFLLQPWEDYLSFVELRHGRESLMWSQGLSLVDDLLWALELKHSAVERERAAGLRQSLLQRIHLGLEHIDYAADKMQFLLQALASNLDLALQEQRTESAPEPVRKKLERDAALEAGLSAEPDSPSAEELTLVDSLKAIEFGSWLDMADGRRLKISWYSSRTNQYMLVNQMGERVDVISGLELARKMINGKAKVISGSAKPLIERALANVLSKLNA